MEKHPNPGRYSDSHSFNIIGVTFIDDQVIGAKCNTLQGKIIE